jgi:hypothetical protein
MEIYTIAGSGEGWSLEVVDQDGGSICSPPTERPMPPRVACDAGGWQA